ncbi:MAG TPA: adenylate/guanylate cyclase domain-containing protein [Chroococcidiopsis sp.]
MPLQNTKENTKAEFDRLLQLRNEHPEKAADIDAKIRDRFAETHALMVLDMAGFSRFTQRYSIIHFLAALRRLCAIAIPVIEQHQGMMVKQDADNIFAIFPEVNCAIEAALDINQSLTAVNSGLPDTLDLHVGVGIGYGELLMIEGHDMFGNEMNLASKLGEDLARSGEILVTEAAYKQVNSPQWSWEELEYSISGLSLVTYKVGKAIAI